MQPLDSVLYLCLDLRIATCGACYAYYLHLKKPQVFLLSEKMKKVF